MIWEPLMLFVLPFKYNVAFECLRRSGDPLCIPRLYVKECTGEVNGAVLVIKKNPLYPFKHASTLKPSLTGWWQPEGCSIHSFCLQEHR